MGFGGSGGKRRSQSGRIHGIQAVARQEQDAADSGKIAGRQEAQSYLRAQRTRDAHRQHYQEKAQVVCAQRRRDSAFGEMGLRN